MVEVREAPDLARFRSGMPDPSFSSERRNTAPYLAWLSSRQASRLTAHPSRSGAESSRESSPSSVHPYGRPHGRGADRHPRRNGPLDASRRLSHDEVASNSSDGYSSISSSPHWVREQHHSEPDAIAAFETSLLRPIPTWIPNTPENYSSDSGDHPPRAVTLSHTGTTNPLSAQVKERARTAIDPFANYEVPSLYSMYLNSANLIQRLDLRSSPERSHGPAEQQNTNPMIDTTGILPELNALPYPAAEDNHANGSNAFLNAQSPAKSSQANAMQDVSQHSMSVQDVNDTGHVAGPYSTSPGPVWNTSNSTQSSPMTSISTQISVDPYHSFPRQDHTTKDTHEGRAASTDSMAMSNAYHAMTKSLQMGSFDWAESPNSNGSFSQLDGNPEAHGKSRTSDLTASWLQRGFPQCPPVSQWRDEDDVSEDNLDLLAEDMMESNSRNYNGTQSSTSVSYPEPVDVFDIGDRTGPGLYHEGQLIRVAETSEGFAEQDLDCLTKQLEVDKLLGRGSYAVVYLVHEVPRGDRTPIDARYEADAVARSFSDNESRTPHAYGRESRGPFSSKTPVADPSNRLHRKPSSDASSDGCPRQFALKCLSKQNLSPEMLELQRIEATIHQSIPTHPNIITLYCTYETSDWLFLVLEYCPGQDLYFWLEEANVTSAMIPSSPVAQDNKGKSAQPDASPFSSVHLDDSEEAPATPWLLARSMPNALLSERRLRLVGDMFHQMCEAVHFCHERGISHRDLKPENFIVEDRRVVEAGPSGEWDSRVVVKLTDFGLATVKDRCDDFNCGSKPYMAFECRHNMAQTYDPKQADVWSLGIVLLNLLFHRSPFKEPSVDHCSSFSAFSYKPIQYLTEAFDGLTESVAQFLCGNIFCDVSKGHARRISARSFGEWALHLPQMLGQHYTGNQREPRGACSSATSPLVLSRAPSQQPGMTETAQNTPSLERHALTNHWMQSHSRRASLDGAAVPPAQDR